MKITDKITITNEDCMELMARYHDNYFDLAIVDPPYGLERFKANDGGNSKKITTFGDKDKNWNNIKPTAEYWNELFRVSKNQIIWGGNYFIDYLNNNQCFIIWDKKQSYDFSLAMCEYAYSSFDFPAKMYSYANRGDEEKLHPSMKPLKLMDFCINFALERDINIKSIFDPFSGSGTTLVSAKSKGLNYVGCELDKDYYEIINKRLSQVQGSLF